MNVTVQEEILIAAPPERVWDFTQDWTRRKQWDPAVLSAEYVERDPPTLRIRAAGAVRFLVAYKLFDRPRRTSLAMTESSSRLLTGGGGAWSYQERAGSTLFSQTNTLTVPRWAFLLVPLLSWSLRRSTRQALRNAKRMLEG